MPEEEERELADDALDSLLLLVAEAPDAEDAVLSAPVTEDAVGVAVTPPHAVSKDAYRLVRWLAADSSRDE